MLFLRGGRGSGTAAAAWELLVRHFSRKRAVDVRRINPKVPREEAKAISQGLHQILKEHGPLSVSNTWNHAKEAGVNGLTSKTHMKILLKWMMGRKMVKLSCTHVGSAKKFLYSTLPEEPQAAKKENSPSSFPSRKPVAQKVSVGGKKQTKKQSEKQGETLV